MFNLTYDRIMLGVDILLIILIGYAYYRLGKVDKIITGVRSNIKENIVEAEVISDWTEKAAMYPPGSPKGQAYRNRLREVGHPYRGD